MRNFWINQSLVVALVAVCSAAQAALVTTTFNLDPADPLTNRLTITVAGVVTTTDLSGPVEVTVNIDPLTGIVSSLTLTGGPTPSHISSSDWMATTLLGTLAGNSIGGTAGTTTPPGAVTGGTAFDADDHSLTLDAGNITLDGGVIQDFVTDPFQMFGDALVPGVLTSTPAGPNAYNLSFAIPFNVLDTLGQAPINITGRMVASGVVAVPEPTAGWLMGSAALLGLIRRRSRRLVRG